MQLSATGNIALALCVALIFSLVFALVGRLASGQENGKIAAFVSDGAVATGTITKKYIDDVRPTAGGVWVYWLDFTFKSADGALHTASENVANTIWARYAVRDPVAVTYVRSKPEWYYIPGDAPTAESAGRSDGTSTIGIYGAALSLFGLFALFFLKHTANA